MDDNQLIKMLQQYGTPAYVFDTTALKDRVRKVQRLWGERVTLCYSIKANPFLIPAMLEVVKHLEVCSPGELEICEALHVPMDAVVYSGVNKEPSDIHQAVSDGVGICTAESLRQVDLLQREAEGDGRLPVLLRLNSGAQFGMSREDLLYVIHNRNQWPDLSIEGIHYFVGTQRKNRDLHQQKEELEMLHDLFRQVRDEEGFMLKRLEYGPGLPVPLFAKDDFSDTLAPAREIADTLKGVTEWADLTVEAGRFFTTECGHYLTKVVDMKTVAMGSEKNPAGVSGSPAVAEPDHTGTAETLVKAGAGEMKRYVIVDGGINHVNYLGQIMGMKQPVIRHFRGNGNPDADWSEVEYRAAGEAEKGEEEYRLTEDSDTEANNRKECQYQKDEDAGTERDREEMYDYAICGSLCTTNDDLVRSCRMEEIRPGDVLVFDNIGAYSVTEGIYLFLSRKMPRIVLYNGDSGTRMVRDFLPTSTLNTPDLPEDGGRGL